MTLAELELRIAGWEDLHTEFKQWPLQPDDVSAALVAFANAAGGQLFLGVSEGRQIAGVPDPDRVLREVDNVAANNCAPPVTVVQQILREVLPGRSIVVVDVPRGDARPYRTNRGVYYLRTSSGRRHASREEILRLFQATESFYYDEKPLPLLGIADIDFAAVEHYLQRVQRLDPDLGVEPLLRSWRLVAGDHPTIAGMVLFGRTPQTHLPFAQINALRFPGTDSSADPSDVKELQGQLLDVIDQAQRFLRLHLPTPHQIRGFEPEAKPELPEEALREAIVNAVVHRDYTVHGPVRLFVFDDRIEVHSPGRAPNTVDEAAMRAGVHVVRNPHLYSRLADAGLVTRAGSGIRRMSRLIREATGRDIGLALGDYEVLVTIPRKEPS